MPRRHHQCELILESVWLFVAFSVLLTAFAVSIQTYRDLKDRQQLIVYGEKLERDSVEYRKIQELLNSGVRGSEQSFLNPFLNNGFKTVTLSNTLTFLQ